jgi:hypothetical protein
MILDSLSLAGLATAALYLLMPVLMGREFIRVDEATDARRETDVRQPRNEAPAGAAAGQLAR